jgi:transitional endoplasmic reticulum ATPase
VRVQPLRASGAAQKFALAVILFDEIVSIAPSRSAENAQHQVSVVAQLLVLLDGIEERGQIFVLATTTRSEHIDPALRRPDRFDQVVWMGLPDERGRAEIFNYRVLLGFSPIDFLYHSPVGAFFLRGTQHRPRG